MKTRDWLIQTHGKPLEALRVFLAAVWKQARLDGFFVPLYDPEHLSTQARLISDPARLAEVNPFLPLMSTNNARAIPSLLLAHPDDRIGVLLRPCELRAMVEMSKHAKFDPRPMLTVGIDCLGTFPSRDFLWRAERKGGAHDLSAEALHFARQGGIMTYRYRAACQLCLEPAASNADLNIGVLGLPVRQVLLLHVHNPQLLRLLEFAELTAGSAGQQLVAQREKMLAKLVERRARTRERILQGLGELIPADPGELVEMFETCQDCQNCLQQCPICSVDFPQPGEESRYRVQDIMRWLVSCAACGMCEQSCPQHHPLTAIFGNIRNQLAGQLGYIPGASYVEELPIT